MNLWASVFTCAMLKFTVAQTPACVKDTRCKKWNAMAKKCTECDVGFQGDCCKLLCRYPNYGNRCQSWCNCERSDCSHMTGCKDGSPTVSPITPSSSKSLLSVSSINMTSPDCPPGYIGSDCKVPCRYPGYSVNCQLLCECEEDLCHHVHGCKTCNYNERPRKDALLYSTISLGVVAVIQFTAYIYLTFFCKVGVKMIIING